MTGNSRISKEVDHDKYHHGKGNRPLQTKHFFASCPIRQKLQLFVLAIFLLASGIIITSGLRYRHHVIGMARDDSLMLVRSLAAQQEQITSGTDLLLSTLAQLPQVQKMDTEDCKKLFSGLIKRHPYYSIIAAATLDGILFATSTAFPTETSNLPTLKLIKNVIETRDFSVGEYSAGRLNKTQSIFYSFPVFDKTNALIAVVIAGFKVDEYTHFMQKTIIPDGTAVIIADHTGVRLFRLPESNEAAIGKPIPETAFSQMSGMTQLGTFETIGEDGIRRLYAFKQLRFSDKSPPYLYMLVGITKDTILHDADLAMLANLFILGMVTVLVLPLIWILGDLTFVRPISHLVAATEQVGKGDLSARTNMLHTHDELGRLSKSFDDMASLLELRDKERLRAEEALRQSEARYRNLFENQIDLYFQTNSEGRLSMVSPSVLPIAGYKPEEILGSEMREFYAHPQDRSEFLKAVLQNDFVENYQLQMKKKDGSILWLAVNARLTKDERGNSLGVEGVARDITDLKEKDKELQKSVSKLQKALDEIQTLKGLVLPICSHCKKIRDDTGYWEQVEAYMAKHTEARFTHGICPDCVKKFYPEFENSNLKDD